MSDREEEHPEDALPLDDSEEAVDEQPVREPPEAPEWPQEADIEPEALEPLKPPEPHEAEIEAPDVAPVPKGPAPKPIGIEPVPDEPAPTRQPVERAPGPQPGMSLKERYADWLAKGGEESGLPRPGRAAPDYEAGEYAQRPEPEFDEEAGRGPGMVGSDPGWSEAAQPIEPAQPESQPGGGSTDALATVAKESADLLKQLVASASKIEAGISELPDKLDDLQEAIEKIETGVFRG